MITFHVSLDGSDAAPGTAEGPFATLARAQRAVRERIAAGLADNVTVLIGGGRYELIEPLVFAPEDSSGDEHTVTWAAAEGERPFLSGGRRITGWGPAEGELWQAEVPGVATGEWHFRQLFVDGRRAVRARSPNVGEYWQLRDGHFAEDYSECTLTLGPEKVDAWGNLGDVEVVMFGHWAASRKRVGRVDPATGVITYAHPHVTVQAVPRAGNWVYLENAREFLDEPGEWYLDRTSGVLSYWPRPGEDMAGAEVIAPRLEDLLVLAGEDGRPVRHLHFRGLAIEHAAWSLPEAGYVPLQACFTYPPPPPDTVHVTRLYFDDFAPVPVEGAVRMEFAEDCSLTACEIGRVGATAVLVRRGCHRNVVEGNEIGDVGGNGVWIGEYWRNVYDHCRERDLKASWAPAGNRVANNHLHDCGVQLHGAVGIGYAFTDGTVIAHNLIHDLPYTGISAGFIWTARETFCRNNRVEANHIHDVMLRMADGGGVYTLGYQPGTVFRGNLIHDVPRNEYAQGAPNNGFFLDEGSKGFRFEANTVYATAGTPVRLNDCKRQWHEWKDNRFGFEPPPGDPAARAAGLEPKYRKRLAGHRRS